MPSIDRYVTPLRLPMSVDLFWRLPRIGGYRAAYRDGQAELTYAPRLSMARLRVARRAERAVDHVAVEPFQPVGGDGVGVDGGGGVGSGASHEALAKLFTGAFARVAPMDAMPATTRRHAADAALRHTASGGDGALVPGACALARDGRTRELLGAALVTRLALRADEWPEPPLPDVLVNLTWLMVAPNHQRRGIATALLDRVVNALADHGTPWLVSHVLDDNVPAVMFHWRSGFELVRKMAGG